MSNTVNPPRRRAHDAFAILQAVLERPNVTLVFGGPLCPSKGPLRALGAALHKRSFIDAAVVIDQEPDVPIVRAPVRAGAGVHIRDTPSARSARGKEKNKQTYA